jgi:two-component system OmpR family response regulator
LRRNSRSLREDDETAAEKYMFGGWVLDCGRRELMSPDAKTARLTSTEFKLLETFALRPNRVLSRNQIMDLVKGPAWAANDRAVDNQIGRLRRKMTEMGDKEEMIQSVRGAGYMLAANVTKVSASDLE